MTTAPRVIVDTNVLLDFWVFDDPIVRPLRDALDAGACLALRSADTDAELAAVLARPEFALDRDRQRALLAAWQARSALIGPVFASPLQCTDPHDQKFLDLAHTARASALVTKDKALLRLARKARLLGLSILAPSSIVDWLQP